MTEREQQLREDLRSRENSTLVIATVAASVSLALFGLFLQKDAQEKNWIAAVGIIFSLVGPLYRALTIYTIDRLQHDQLKRIMPENRRDENHPPWWAVVPRMFIVRILFYLPIFAWLVIIPLEWWPWILLLFLLPILALVFSIIEWLSRDTRNQTEVPSNDQPYSTFP